jgi:hypothetical protein
MDQGLTAIAISVSPHFNAPPPAGTRINNQPRCLLQSPILATRPHNAYRSACGIVARIGDTVCCGQNFVRKNDDGPQSATTTRPDDATTPPRRDNDATRYNPLLLGHSREGDYCTGVVRIVSPSLRDGKWRRGACKSSPLLPGRSRDGGACGGSNESSPILHGRSSDGGMRGDADELSP